MYEFHLDQFAKMIIALRVGTPYPFIFRYLTQQCMFTEVQNGKSSITITQTYLVYIEKLKLYQFMTCNLNHTSNITRCPVVKVETSLVQINQLDIDQLVTCETDFYRKFIKLNLGVMIQKYYKYLEYQLVMQK